MRLPIPIANDWRVIGVSHDDNRIYYDSTMDLSVSDAELAQGRPAARIMLMTLTCTSPALVQVINAGGSVQINATTSNGASFSEVINRCG